jgi:hypothetical protein
MFLCLLLLLALLRWGETLRGTEPLTGPLTLRKMTRLNIQQWRNDADIEKPKGSEKIPSQCQFVHHKSRMNCRGYEVGPRSVKPVINSLRYGMAALSPYA